MESANTNASVLLLHRIGFDQQGSRSQYCSSQCKSSKVSLRSGKDSGSQLKLSCIVGPVSRASIRLAVLVRTANFLKYFELHESSLSPKHSAILTIVAPFAAILYHEESLFVSGIVG